MGSLKMVVLSGYDTVKSALVDYADEFAERPHIPIFEDINSGFGIPFSHGENWKAMRRFTLSKLRDFGMGKRTIEDRIVEECGFIIKLLESLEGKPTDLTVKTNFAIGNIIISIILGHRLDYQDPTLFKVMRIVDENMRLLGSPSIAIYNIWPFFQYLPGNHLKIKRNIEEFYAIFKGMIAEHRKLLDRDDQRGYIDAFLVKQEEGTYVIPLLESVLYDETQFEKPRSFFPEHFLDSDGQFVKRAAFMPFSAGRRTCAGETLAKMELFLFFTSLMQKFSFCPAPNITDFNVKPFVGLTIPPMPQKICCVPRI
ncbi:cytochrome P450 2K4-like isoform X2 [Dendropsophus ebraccatus]